MSNISFSLSDYQAGLAAGRYTPPATLCPYYEVDPVEYRKRGNSGQRRDNLLLALYELRKRTERTYFDKTYPLQARTLDFSARAFPAYRFILPEVVTEDWLAIMDWGKFQRDHVLHQPLCGYVVLKLLCGDGIEPPLSLPVGNTLLETCVDNILSWKETGYIRDFLLGCGLDEKDKILQDSSYARNVWRILFREVAYVAAIFHDLGYPWQYAERIQGNLEGGNAPAIRQNRSASQIVDGFGYRMLFRALHGYQMPDAACPSTWHERIIRLTDTAMSKRHGFLGALGFLHLNDCVRKFPSERELPLHLLCVEWAAAAIMMHDMVKIYWGERGTVPKVPENPFLRLSFEKDPLSAIVMLADVIQDFERPTVTFGRCNIVDPEQVTLAYETGCTGADLILNGSSMAIEYKMNDSRSRAIKRKFLLSERSDYFDAQYGYLDMTGLGIKDVQMTAV